MRKRNFAGVLAGALLALGATFSGAQAQKPVEQGDVTILNDHIDVHQVYVFDAEGRRHSLGFIGHEQVKTYTISDKIKEMGPYRIALQQWTPLPGIGVSVQAPPMKMTGSIRLAPGEAAAIVVDNDRASVEFFPAVNAQQQFQF
jgi:hypothetical protein